MKNLTEQTAEQLFGAELRSEADDFIRLTMEMKNDRTKILENQGFRTCRFYFIKIYMEFDYYLIATAYA